MVLKLAEMAIHLRLRLLFISLQTGASGAKASCCAGLSVFHAGGGLCRDAGALAVVAALPLPAAGTWAQAMLPDRASPNANVARQVRRISRFGRLVTGVEAMHMGH